MVSYFCCWGVNTKQIFRNAKPFIISRDIIGDLNTQIGLKRAALTDVLNAENSGGGANSELKKRQNSGFLDKSLNYEDLVW